MPNDPVLHLIGLARKAGRLEIGAEPVGAVCRSRHARLLLLAQDHGIEVVEIACDLAVEQNTLRLPAIVNLINQLVEPVIPPLGEPYTYPQLTMRPEADCKRYEALCSAEEAVA